MLDYQSSLTRDPAAGTGAINSAGVNQINRNYDALPGRIATQLAGRGFGSSGQAGDQFYQAGNDRLNNLSQFQAQMNKLILDRQAQGASLGEDLLNANRGTTSSSSTTSSGTGTQTGPGNGLSSGLTSAGNGLSNLSTLLMLQKVLGGGGGSGSSSGGGGYGDFLESGG